MTQQTRYIPQKPQGYHILSDEYVRNMRQNASLPKNAWEQIDGAVVAPFRAPNTMLTDLQSRGLTVDIDFGVLYSQWQDISDMTDAQRSIDGGALSEQDSLKYGLNTVPIPIIHKEYGLGTRQLRASQNSDVQSLDTTLPQTAGRIINDNIEDLIANGDTRISAGNGNVIYGYTTDPNRNTISIGSAWTNATPTNPLPVDDTNSMLQAGYDDNIFDPRGMYVPKNWWGFLQNDYSPEAGKTWMDRILEFADVEFVHLGRALPDSNVVMVQLAPQTIDVAIARGPTTVSWESGDGFHMHFKSYAALAPRTKSDQDNRSGIVHAS